MRARYHNASASPSKALEVILWLAKRHGRLDFYHILKVLYYADKYHINRYGRPILGDRYEAFPRGPVARMVYDILKSDPLELQALDYETGQRDGNLPFVVEGKYWVRPLRPCNEDALSTSDIEALQVSFQKYGAMPFNELQALTHDEFAWQHAADHDESMRYEHFIEGDDAEEKVADIVRTSRQTVF